MLCKLFLTALILSFASVAYAIPIDVTVPCTGGSIAVTGDYNPVTAAFTANFVETNCQIGDVTTNGTFTSSGTFLFTSDSTANVSVTYSFQTSELSGGGSLTDSCSGTLIGTYNTSTEFFQGSGTKNCTGSGGGVVSIVDLLSGVLL
jgi:hypothetical protein